MLYFDAVPGPAWPDFQSPIKKTEAVSTTTVTLQWGPAKTSKYTGLLFSFDPAPINGSADLKQKRNDTDRTFTVSNLRPGQEYNVWIHVEENGIKSYDSITIIFYTSM